MKGFGSMRRVTMVLGVLVLGLVVLGCDNPLGEEDTTGDNNPYMSSGNPITAEARYSIEYVDPDTADTSVQASTSYNTATGRESFVTHNVPQIFTSGVVTVEDGTSWIASVTTGISGNDAWDPETGSTTTKLKVTLELRVGDETDFRTIQTSTVNSLNAVDISEMVTNY